MWVGLMLFTGVGAYFGAIFFIEVSKSLFALMEGVAAGAMLTMIAETMLPEAYHKGGAITGVSTLLGFLAAIFFKTLDEGEQRICEGHGYRSTTLCHLSLRHSIVPTFSPTATSISVSAITSCGVNPGATSSRTKRFPSQRRSARSVTT